MSLKISQRKVLKSAAGYYIGRDCIEGPYCRESKEYYRTEEDAQVVLDAHYLRGVQLWTPRLDAIELQNWDWNNPNEMEIEE